MFASAFVAALALASSVRAAPVAISLATVEAALSLPNTTQNDNVTYYYQNGNAGACGLYSEDSDLVAGLPYEFYNNTGAVSSYCGTYIVITSKQNNETVTARVADASATNGTLSISVATYEALDGAASNLETVSWRFANETEEAAAKKALGTSSSSSSTVSTAKKTTATSVRASSTSVYVAPSTTESEVYVAPTTTTTTSEYVAPTTTQAPTTTSEYDYASASSVSQASADAAWASSSSSQAAADAAWASSSSSAAAAAYTTTTTTEAPQATAESYSSSSASSGTYSGTATYFYQGGNPGNCGTVHSDSDYVVAITTAMYNGGAECGRTVHICTDSGACVDATVADSCPSCVSEGSLDLSVAAFNAISTPDAGVAAISWSFSS